MDRKFANVCLIVVLCIIISVFAGCSQSKTDNAVSPPDEKAAAESSDVSAKIPRTLKPQLHS